MEYTESDLLWRIIEPLYDVSWAYHMSSTVDHVAKRMERRRKTFSSTASVVSTATTATLASFPSTAELSVSDKVVALEQLLHRVSRVMRARQFEDICRVSLKSSDDLYPGFRDVLFIAQFLLERGEPYRGQLSGDETNGLTLTQVFQYIFYEFCSFLVSGNRVGREAIKLIITPTKITHAAYDLCRQKFARLLADQTGIVQDGLLRLIARIQKDREPEPKVSHDDTRPIHSQQDVVVADDVVVVAADADNASEKEEAVDVVVQQEPEKNTSSPPAPSPSSPKTTKTTKTTKTPQTPQTPSPEPPTRTKPSPGKGRRRPPAMKRRTMTTTASVASRVSFPIIEVSSDEGSSSYESSSSDSVSSLDSGI